MENKGKVSPIYYLTEEELAEINKNTTQVAKPSDILTRTVRKAIRPLNEEERDELSQNLMQTKTTDSSARTVQKAIRPLSKEERDELSQNLMQTVKTLDFPAQTVRKVIGSENSSSFIGTAKDTGNQQNGLNSVEKDLPCQVPIEISQNYAPYANCSLVVAEDIHYLDRNGNDDDGHENEININVYLRQIPVKPLGNIKIAYHNIVNVVKLVKNRFPITIFTKDAVKEHWAEDDIRQQLIGIPIKKCYKNAGWNWVDNEYQYLFGNHHREVLVQTKLNLPFYTEWDARQSAKVWQVAYNIYTDEDIARVLNIFTFSGVTFKLFDMAGYPPRFLLFITGKTGSLKTSLSKVLYTQLARDECREQPRRIDMDTGTSFERALIDEGYDTITFFDDFAPAKTQNEKKILADNFERIVRMVGDGSTKSRSNRRLENCRGEGVHGSVVITGEVMGEGLSSNLRCLYINIERDKVNLETLTWLQEYKFGISTLIKHFSDFLNINWNSVLRYIQSQYPIFRQQIKSMSILSQERSKERYVYFMILSEIVKTFFQNYCHLDDDSLRKSFDNIQDSILRVLSVNESVIEGYDPIKNFIASFVKLMSTRKIKISSKKFRMDELNLWDGYEDENFIYIFEECLYSKVKEHLTNTLVPYYLSLRETKNMLAEEGFIVTCPNGNGKKTYSARINIEGSDKKIDFLKFNKIKLFEIVRE